MSWARSQLPLRDRCRIVYRMRRRHLLDLVWALSGYC